MIYCIFFGGSVLQHVEAVTFLAVEVVLTTLRNSPESISDGDSDTDIFYKFWQISKIDF